MFCSSFLPVGRRDPVHVCSRGAADGDVSLQVQADEADPDVQGPQTRHLLPFQHSKGVREGEDGGGSGRVCRNTKK